ncbi:hypothetical protein [Chryseobacterium sp. A321]
MEKQKVIIFGAPTAYNVSNEIKKNLDYLGFKVIDISFPQEFTYKSKIQKLTNFIRKTLFQDRDYKNRLRFKPFETKFETEISNLPQKADFALFIRPDCFPIGFLKWTLTHCITTCAYQWDGIDLFPQVKRYIPLFDRFFVFDPADLLKTKNVLPTTNFYFDYHSPFQGEADPKVVYFVGSYFKNRMDPIEKIIERILSAEFVPKIHLLTKNSSVVQQYKHCGALFIDSFISFDQNLENVKKAGVLIDFVNGRHDGLSFRTFEAIGYEKKLITNNAEIKKYEFYHPDNFFVWEEHSNFEGLEEFLKRPYRTLDSSLKQKYSFTNWIHYILELPPYEAIKLPVLDLGEHRSK